MLIDSQRVKRKVLSIKSISTEFWINQLNEKEFLWDSNLALFLSYKPQLENQLKIHKSRKQWWRCSLILQKPDKTLLKIQNYLTLLEPIQQTTTQIVNKDSNFETSTWLKTTQLLKDEESFSQTQDSIPKKAMWLNKTSLLLMPLKCMYLQEY